MFAKEGVCLWVRESVCIWVWGVCLWVWGCLHLGLGVYTPRQTTPWADTPLDRHPLGRHSTLSIRPPTHCMLGYTHPWREF